MSRFEEVVNEAIGEVVLSESPLSGRDARAARRRAGARAPGRRARGGHDRGALPRAQAGPGVGCADAGDLHALRARRRLRARHAPGRRCLGDRHDRLPLRAGAGRRARRERGWREDGFSAEQIERILAAVPVATHNQRGLGTLHIGCLEGCERARSTRGRCWRSSRAHVLGDLRADEALRRGRRGRKGAPPPALRRGLRTRDDRRRRRGVRRARRSRVRARPPGEPRDDPPAQRDRRTPRPARGAAQRDRVGCPSRRARPRSRSGWTAGGTRLAGGRSVAGGAACGSACGCRSAGDQPCGACAACMCRRSPKK